MKTLADKIGISVIIIPIFLIIIVAIIQSVIIKIYPFTSDPKQFKLKFIPLKLDFEVTEIANVKYSANGGKTWKYIHKAGSKYRQVKDGLITSWITIGGDYEEIPEYKYYECKITNIEQIKSKFTCLHDIEEFEELEYRKYKIESKSKKEELEKRHKEHLNKKTSIENKWKNANE